MPTLTVLTACLPAKAEHLGAAADSVARLREIHPHLEWILVLDGPGDASAPAGTTRVIRTDEHRGVSASRNYALAVATGEFAVNLDADDELVPEGVIGCLSHLVSRDLGWVAANRLLLTGERTVHWHGQRDWALGEVAAGWTAPSAFHANTLVVRTDLLRLVGGWPALGACEDLLLAFRLGEESRGASVDDVLIRYRSWPGQATAAPGFRDEQELAYDFIEQSINAERVARGRSSIRRPETMGGLGSVPLEDALNQLGEQPPPP